MITEGDKNTILGIKLQFQIGVGFLVRQIQSQGFGGLSQNICTVYRYVVMVNILRKGLDTVESLLVEASGFTNTRAFPTKSGQNISSSVGITKTRAFAAKSGQNISSSLGVAKSRTFVAKSGQNISSSVGVTKSRAFAAKSGQNISSSVRVTKIGKMSDLVAELDNSW